MNRSGPFFFVGLYMIRGKVYGLLELNNFAITFFYFRNPRKKSDKEQH